MRMAGWSACKPAGTHSARAMRLVLLAILFVV